MSGGPIVTFDVAQFVETFQVVPEAESGIASIRALIRALAVTGRLLTNATSNESSSTTMARLLRASEAAAGDPKFEARLRAALVEEKSAPWAIPETWRFFSLEECAAGGGLFADGDWVESKDQDPGGDIRLTQLADVGDGVFRDRSDRSMNRAAAERLNCTFLQRGDILVARMPEPLGRACVFPGDRRSCATVVDVAILRVNSRFFLPEYIALTINSPLVRQVIGGLAAGTTRQRVSRGNLAGVLVPVPPLAEQKRIVAKVDQLMALCDDLEARQAKKREIGTRLTKSALEALTIAESPAEFAAAWKRVEDNFDILIDRAEKVSLLRGAIVELAVRGNLAEQRHDDGEADALLDRIEAERAAATASGARVPTPLPIEQAAGPYPIPSRWRWVRWGHLALGSDSGWSPQCEARPRDGDEWGVVKVSAVSWNAFKPEENKALPGGEDARPACAIHAGDFLMSRANTADLVGRSVIVDAEPVRLMMSDKIVRCTFAGSVNKRYVNLFNQTASARAHYIANASGTSDSMKNISRDVVFSMPVALPPLAEQDRIVARVQQLVQICDDLEAKLLRAEDRAARLVEAAVQELVAS